MKLTLLAVFIAAFFQANEGKKLRLLAGVNGGVLTGVNPGLVVGGVNPGLVVGGVNPALLGGAGFLGQPQFGQMVPGFGFLQPQAFPAGPFGLPNAGLQPQQFPGQYQYPGLPANGLPYPGFPQMAGMMPPQQQVMGGPGNAGNGMQQQGPPQSDPVKRFKRFLMRKAQASETNPDSQTQTQAPTSAAAERAATSAVCKDHDHV
ncbi:secretory calcium-binding phosphoprotein 9 [Osmerus eperlanus]|uniref:secretory calcium-binding phosphoprotein 9 n=1 Tax=Osmerus eperlanus TaxID=29151 RepID=UPI002E12009D